MSPREAAAEAKKKPLFKNLAAHVESDYGKPLEDIVEYGLTGKITPEEKVEPEAPQRAIQAPPPQLEIEQPKQIKKGEIVYDPKTGIVGDLKDVKNKEGLLDDNGKLHKVRLEDLKEPDEDVRKTVSRLLEIPEIDKSAQIAYWAYDKPSDELFVTYHNGETYKYLEVPDDIKQEIENSSAVPKTEGETVYGAWSQDQKPEYSPQAGKEIVSRGATLSKLIIHNPKYKKPKKGQPPNPLYRKLNKGYDYWQKLRT